MLSGQTMSIVDRYKYEGVIFDEHLTFELPGKALADSAERALGKLLVNTKALKAWDILLLLIYMRPMLIQYYHMEPGYGAS
jgi:hypothetical protein